MSFLAEASRMLAESLDYETTLATVARLSLPYLGAWCIVDICTDGQMRRVAVLHTEPELQALARRLESGWPPERDDPFGVPRAVLTRKTEVIPDIPDDMLVQVSKGDDNLQVLRSLGMGSLLIVPLLARGRVLGAITFVSPRGGQPHGGDDVVLAEDLAARCAIALDNARLHQEVEAARDVAERASSSKSQFLAIMSHELRTPLTGVIAYAELLETEVLGPMEVRQREACARIKANSWHLVSIIDEILVISRAEAGRLEVHAEESDVPEIVWEVARSLAPQVELRGVSLVLESRQAPPRLLTDPGKVRQIVLNLIGNAVKYTQQGQITVTTEWDEHSEALCIHVEDTGPGIPPEQHERIFEPFTQGDQSDTRVVGGTGLGLAISIKLARLLGGDITLRSTVGQGSVFTLHLPSRG